MRQRLLLRDAESLSDLDVLQMVLAKNRFLKTTKSVTREMFYALGGFYGILSGKADILDQVGLPFQSIGVFDLIHEAARRLASAESRSRVLITDTDALTHYLSKSTTTSKVACVYVLLLNSRRQLLDEMIFQDGLDPEVIAVAAGKRLLKVDATSFVLATIRPNRSHKPTAADRELTDRISEVSAALSAKFYEHIVFCSQQPHSLKFELDMSTHEASGLARLNKRDNGGLDREGRKLANNFFVSKGFSDSDEFDTLIVNKFLQGARNSRIEDVSRGSHKLWTSSDNELLRLLLTQFYTTKTAEIVDAAMERYRSFASVLAAPAPDLMTVPGLSPRCASAIKLVHTAAIRFFRAAVMDQPSLDDSGKIIRYLTATLSRENVEHFRILFVDSNGRLRADEAQSRGTVDHTPVYPREIIRRAFELDAKLIILVHNHPSGNPTASQEDIDMTRVVAKAASAMGITVWDHIIIGNGKYMSFREQDLVFGRAPFP